MASLPSQQPTLFSNVVRFHHYQLVPWLTVLKKIHYLLLPSFVAVSPHLSKNGGVVVIHLVGICPHSFFHVILVNHKLFLDLWSFFSTSFQKSSQQTSLCTSLARTGSGAHSWANHCQWGRWGSLIRAIRTNPGAASASHCHGGSSTQTWGWRGGLHSAYHTWTWESISNVHCRLSDMLVCYIRSLLGWTSGCPLPSPPSCL